MNNLQAPYTLGLGSSGAHNTFRPLTLTICNSTFLPATQQDLVLVQVAHGWTDSFFTVLPGVPTC